MIVGKDEDLESYESEDEEQDESVAARMVPFLVESRHNQADTFALLFLRTKSLVILSNFVFV